MPSGCSFLSVPNLHPQLTPSSGFSASRPPQESALFLDCAHQRLHHLCMVLHGPHQSQSSGHPQGISPRTHILSSLVCPYGCKGPFVCPRFDAQAGPRVPPSNLTSVFKGSIGTEGSAGAVIKGGGHDVSVH